MRLARDGEDGFRLGSAGHRGRVAPLLEPCSCGGRLEPGAGAGEPIVRRVSSRMRCGPWPRRAGRCSNRRADPRLREIAGIWRPRALRALGREDELTAEELLELRLEGRLQELLLAIERAEAAGDVDAAEAAHARYVELGTTYVQQVRPWSRAHCRAWLTGSPHSSLRTSCSTPGQPVLALVSGGADSLCLWGVLRELGHTRPRRVHVNHGLRGAEADADAAFCAALGATVVRVDVAAGGNLEARAREARWRPARELADGRPVATGHTLSDQAETVLYRLASSSGPRALAGDAAPRRRTRPAAAVPDRRRDPGVVPGRRARSRGRTRPTTTAPSAAT